MFLHNTKAFSNGQQFPLLLIISGQVAEENHLTAMTFDLSDRPVHQPVRRPLVLLKVKQKETRSVFDLQFRFLTKDCDDAESCRHLDDHQSLGQVEGDGFAVQRRWVLLVVVHHVQSLLVTAQL